MPDAPAPDANPRRPRAPRQPPAAVLPEPEGYLRHGERYASPETRALFFTTYLAAARISEALSLRVRNLQFVPANEARGTPEHFAFSQIPVLKRRENNRKEDGRKIHKWRVAPVWVADKPSRGCGKTHGPTYLLMLNHVAAWAKTKTENEPLFRWRPDFPERFGFKPEEIQNAPGRAAAYAAIASVPIEGRPFNPHHNRHARITHLITHEGYTVSQARKYTEQSKIESLSPYSHLEYGDLLPR
jgi:integrase